MFKLNDLYVLTSDGWKARTVKVIAVDGEKVTIQDINNPNWQRTERAALVRSPRSQSLVIPGYDCIFSFNNVKGE